MTTTSKATKKAANAAANEQKRQVIKAVIESAIKQYFSSTLGTQDDIVNIFLALIYLESRFDVDAVGKEVNESVSSGARDYWGASAIQKIQQTGSGPQKENIILGKKALGLTQIMGWNVVIGGSKSGKCVMESIRPDLVGMLCVSPGESLEARYLGESNMSNAIIAGLAILESKWKACKKDSDGWHIGSRYFPLRISAAVGGYLGLGKADVVTGLTPQAYAANIVGGSMYLAANGPSAPAIRDSKVQYASNSAKGPITTPASAKNRAPAGCIKADSTSTG